MYVCVYANNEHACECLCARFMRSFYINRFYLSELNIQKTEAKEEKTKLCSSLNETTPRVGESSSFVLFVNEAYDARAFLFTHM